MNLKSLPIIACFSVFGIKANAQCNDAFSLTLTPTPVCSGKGFSLDATSLPGGIYTWTGPTGSGANTNSGDDFNVGSAIASQHNGAYTVTVQLPNGCTYNASLTVSVETTPAKPVVTFKSPICPMEEDTMYAITSGLTGVSFFWSGPNGFTYTSSASNMAVVEDIVPAGEGTYQVYAVSAQGCTSETTSYYIDVHPQVIANFTPEYLLGCDKDSVELQNTSTGASSTNWSFGDGTSNSSTISPVHTYYTQGSYTVRLISGNAFCFDTLDKVITFNHSITADFTVDDDSICQGTAINFTNNSSAMPTFVAPTYEWDFGNGATDIVEHPAYTYQNYGQYIATLIATDYLGCKDTIKHNILVDSAGSIMFTASETEICPGTSIDFKGMFMEWQNEGAEWDMGDGNSFIDQKELTYTFDREGLYPVTFLAKYRICPSVQVVKNILVKPNPKINIGPDLEICPNGQPLTLKDLINENNGKAKWRWNDETRSTTSSALIRHAGTYSATVEIDGCSSSDTAIVTNNCFISIPNVFSPNGDGKEDYFLPRQFLSKGISSFDMKIFNRWGQQVFATNRLDGRGWDGKYNNAEQPMGVYVYLINASFINGSTEKYDGNLTLIR